ncbi:hypothetical protein LOAG_16643 [Loa loa]|uniref:Uncharacterized protein n=1 Tax=Loa loa TaxID=7209 RepID=A0A1S0ULV5_LOALO|nr:hypothetical protein LOAG_16643 [Loa loa]EJD76406.1 hypothetical protein LOAG_16643 [Loa loa]
MNVGRPYKHRLTKNANWSYGALSLFKDKTKNRPKTYLKIAKGSSSVTLSRNFVDFMVEYLNLTTLIEMFLVASQENALMNKTILPPGQFSNNLSPVIFY